MMKERFTEFIQDTQARDATADGLSPEIRVAAVCSCRTLCRATVFALLFFSCMTSVLAAYQRASEAKPPQEHFFYVPDESGIVPLEGEAREQAVLLIRQLASPEFEVRQNASRELWKLGPPVLELLQSAVKGGINSEARMRAKDLATLIKVGVEHDADSKTVGCVVGFLDREILVQSRAISKLCFLGKRKVAQKLIGLVPSESDRNSLTEHCSMEASDAELALRLGEENKFQDWINDPATRESQKLFYYYYLWIDNKLDDEINRLKEESKAEIEAAAAYDVELKKQQEKEKAKNKGKAKKKKEDESKESDKAPKQPRLRTLIGLLRFTGQWEQATEYSKKVYDRKARKDLVHSILMEGGNWKGLAKLIVEPDSDDDDEDESEDEPHDGLAFPAEGYRKALIHFYAGNEAEFEAAIGEIESKIEEEFQKQKKRGAEPTKGNSQHAQFLRYTLNFDRAIKFSPLKKDRSTFLMLSSSRRYAKLFEMFNLETFEARAKYFKARVRHIRSLHNQVEKFVKSKNEEQKDVYADKRSTALQNWRDVVGLLATLGLNEEAELYYRKLYFEFANEIKANLAYQAIDDLQAMGAYDSAWEIAQLEQNRKAKINFRSALFDPDGYDHDAVNFLNAELKKTIKDPIERFRKIAVLVKSPSDVSNQKIDFWKEIAGIDFSKQSAAIRQLFLIWGLEEEILFQRSASASGDDLIEQLMANGEYLAAAQKFEAMALTEGYPVYYAKAWHAYTKDGNAAKAKQMKLLFGLKFDPEDAYDYTSGYNGTHWQSLPFDAFRLNDCLESTKVGINCYYMWRIAADDMEAVLSAHQKMVRSQILRLRYIDSPYFHDSEADHPRFIDGCLEAGDVELARYWFRRLSSFEPADSGFVEANFPVYQKLGNDEFVDEMFQKVSDDFYEILKSFPDSAMYLNNYSWACACAKRNVKNAIELSKRAVELRPGTAGYYDTLAELYHIDGQQDKAITTIQRAIEINPMREYYQTQKKKFEAAKSADSK